MRVVRHHLARHHPGPGRFDGNDWTTGALFLSTPVAYFTFQSVILDTSTMEPWVHFGPGFPPPLVPTYVRVAHALE